MATVIEPNASSANTRMAELVRLRSKYLKNDRIFGPAWIILLKLASQSASGRSSEVCDLISVTEVPATAAQRCLDYLLLVGLVRLAPGPGKRFRSVQFASHTLEELQALIASVADADALEREYAEII